MRFDNAIVDGHGHVSFPDRQIQVSELSSELGNRFKFKAISGAKYTVAIENDGKIIVGWMNVNTLGYDDIDSMIDISINKGKENV